MEISETPLQIKKRPSTVKSMAEIEIVDPPNPPPVEEKKIETPPTNTEDDFSLNEPPPKKEEPPKQKTKEDNMRELARLRDEAEARAKKSEEEFVKYKQAHEPRIVELETLVEKTAFEKSRKFQTQFEQPVIEAQTALSTFIKDLGENEETVNQIQTLTGKEQLEFLDATFNSPTAATEILRLVKAVGAKKSAREAAIVNYKQTQEQFQQSDEVEQAQITEKLEQNFQLVLSKLTPKVSLLREREGDVEHNNSVAERIKTAKAIMMGTAKEEDILTAPFLAVTARDYIRRNAELIKELDKYKKRVGEITESTPSIKHGSLEQGNAPKKPKGMLAVMEESTK